MFLVVFESESNFYIVQFGVFPDGVHWRMEIAAGEFVEKCFSFKRRKRSSSLSNQDSSDFYERNVIGILEKLVTEASKRASPDYTNELYSQHFISFFLENCDDKLSCETREMCFLWSVSCWMILPPVPPLRQRQSPAGELNSRLAALLLVRDRAI